MEFLEMFAPRQKLKLLSNDPGVKNIFTALQLCSDAQDIRDTLITMSSKEYHFLCGTRVGALLMAAERLNFLKLFDADERAKNGRSLFLENATAFRNLVLEHFDQIQLMNRSRRTKKLHARKFAAKQHAIAIAANRLTAHEKDETVVLLYGRGSEKDGFTGSKIRGNVFGPAKTLYEYIRRHRLAITIWVSEHRTSQLSLEGVPVHHPWESRAKVINKRRHKCSRNLDRGDNGLHPLNTVGCRCYCSTKGCEKERTQGTKCDDHFRPYRIYGLSIDGQRAWNRDVLAAINIGLLFIAHVLRIEDIGLWTFGTHLKRDAAKAKPWRDILGDEIFDMLNVSLAGRSQH